MYNVIYTEIHGNTNKMDAKTWEFALKDNAIELFEQKVKDILEEAFNDSFLNCSMSMYDNKAIIKIVGTQYTVAIVEDCGVLRYQEAN